MMARRLRSKIADRPAETSAIIAAVLGVLAVLGIHLSEDEQAGIVAVVGLVAAAVTWFIERRRRAD
jgi:predicted aconitase